MFFFLLLIHSFSLLTLLVSYLNVLANWAQSTGQIQQNIVISRYPSPEYQHWNPRYGMAAVVVPMNSSESARTFLYVMGGDSYTGDGTERDYKPGLFDDSWENGYKNDGETIETEINYNVAHFGGFL